MGIIPGDISEEEPRTRPAAEEPCCDPKQGWQCIETVTDVSTQYHVISLQANMEKMVSKVELCLHGRSCCMAGFTSLRI